MSDDTALLHNVTFDALQIGQSASLTRVLTQKDIDLFAAVSGDVNPAHLDPEYARNSLFHEVIGHGMWAGGLISTVLGTQLPGPGTIYLGQEMKFTAPVHLGDTLTVTLTVKSKHPQKPVVTFDCQCTNQKGEVCVSGTATVLAPTEKLAIQRPETPEVSVYTNEIYLRALERVRPLGRIRVAVVHPVKASAIQGAYEAWEQGLIEPVLIGPEARIRAAAEENGTDISGWELIGTEHSHAAGEKAVELAASGEVEAIMKGALHTDELLRPILTRASGLRTERRVSHAFVLYGAFYHKPIIITDAAVNIAPDLEQKADICRNSIDLWRVLFGTAREPKVAILAAVETVTPSMPATLDAAALCKMADRGQITGGQIDGPLAFDNIISKQAAEEKGIVSEVAGDADIIVVPDIEAGNALAKQLIFFGKAHAAGILLGARVPVILTSRADTLQTRILSCVIAVSMAKARREGLIK